MFELAPIKWTLFVARRVHTYELRKDVTNAYISAEQQ